MVCLFFLNINIYVIKDVLKGVRPLVNNVLILI
jgi:hypothetical protein